MANLDFLIYAVHTGFWWSFGATRIVLRLRERKRGGTPEPVVGAPQDTTAPFSRALVAFHALGFGVMYFGMGNAVIPARVPVWFTGQRIVGAIVSALGAIPMNWALLHFQSWRFRAKLEQGHQLASGGPFGFVRHPIYLSLTLLALGTAIWVPTALVWGGFALMAIGSDLRARSEERLLERAFGQTYRDYMARTKRFIPGIY